MKKYGIFLMLCAMVQPTMAMSEAKLNLLCPTASRQKMVSALQLRLKTIEKGINNVDNKGKTALMLAVQQNNRAAACYLIAQDADVSLKDKSGKMAVDYACSAEMRELLNACLPNTGGAAISHEQIERQAQMEGIMDKESRNARLRELAVRPGMLSEISKLLRMEADLNATAPDGSKLADLPGLTPEYLAYFIRRGYSLNTDAKKGRVPRLRSDMSAPMARLMMALGVKAAMDDEPALLLEALFSNNVRDLSALLSENEELAKTRTTDNRSLLALAQSPAAVRALVEAGADAKEEGLLSSIISRSASNPCDANVIYALLTAGASMPEDALTQLCKVGNGDPQTLRILIEAGADAKATDDAGNTLLHLLLKNKAAQIHAADAAKALVKAGANPKAKNNDGQSALQLAKALGREDFSKAISKGAK